MVAGEMYVMLVVVMVWSSLSLESGSNFIPQRTERTSTLWLEVLGCGSGREHPSALVLAKTLEWSSLRYSSLQTTALHHERTSCWTILQFSVLHSYNCSEPINPEMQKMGTKIYASSKSRRQSAAIAHKFAHAFLHRTVQGIDTEEHRH